jgi:nitrite reductase/ring-hydroxylating ferredoxin subunit
MTESMRLRQNGHGTGEYGGLIEDTALTEDTIPAARYTSAAFLRKELGSVWPHTWQVACRLEEIPNRGDYYEYNLYNESIMVVRQEDGSVKAFSNVCRHRSTRLVQGCGSLGEGNIRCRYHGWSWKISGDNVFVLDRGEFRKEGMSERDLALVEVPVGIRWGFVFICPAEPYQEFEDFLRPVMPMLDPVGVDAMRYDWYKSTVLPCNWKVALDAFVENYHVPRTHPQLILDHNAYDYLQLPNGHAHNHTWNGREGTFDEKLVKADRLDEREQLYRAVSNLADQVNAIYTDREKFVAGSLRRQPIDGDRTASVDFIDALHAYAKGFGIDLPRLSKEDSQYLGVTTVFPNIVVLTSNGNLLGYRSRPNGLDPNSCHFDVWSLRLFPQGEEPPLRRDQVDWTDAEKWRLVLSQDFSNMPEVTAGLQSRHSRGYKLNTKQEMAIMNMHQEIDRYIAQAESGVQQAENCAENGVQQAESRVGQ